MQFTSFEFAVFFPVVVLIFYILPKKCRQFWLLAASYYFYMGWNAKYALLIFVSTIVTYLCGIALGILKHKKKNKWKRISVICAGLVINLGILVFFNYFYFLHESVAVLVGIFGFKLKPAGIDILLPVGISFYTFQAVGYMIDVYRGTVKVEKNFIRYALFVSFFPQLVAGPIERSGHLLHQIDAITHKNSWDFNRVTRGLLLMLWGFFMKMVIADRAAVLVNTVFDIYYMFQGAALLLAIFFFTIQIYCDFASYSIIAMGTAKVLGIELMANFEAPFFSRSVSEFWRRWHVSLSSWFRDYVYIPLGGSRCSRVRKYFNNMVTFVVSGLWHGASWHFVFWGALQGLFIIIGDMLKPIKLWLTDRFQVRVHSFGYRFFQGVTTFGLFMISLVFFRAETVRDGFYYIQRLFTKFDIWSFANESIYTLGLDRKEMNVLWVGIFILIFVDAFYARRKAFFDTMVKSQCLAVQYVIVAVLLVMIVVFGVYGEGYDATQFIYFQF